jgi:hypothetical protein
MKKITFTTPINVVDSDNDIIMPNALITPDKKIPVLINFETSVKSILGYCSVSEIDNNLIINSELNLSDNLDKFELEHGIGFTVLESAVNEKGNRVISKIKLHCVGVFPKVKS